MKRPRIPRPGRLGMALIVMGCAGLALVGSSLAGVPLTTLGVPSSLADSLGNELPLSEALEPNDDAYFAAIENSDEMKLARKIGAEYPVAYGQYTVPGRPEENASGYVNLSLSATSGFGRLTVYRSSEQMWLRLLDEAPESVQKKYRSGQPPVEDDPELIRQMIEGSSKVPRARIIVHQGTCTSRGTIVGSGREITEDSERSGGQPGSASDLTGPFDVAADRGEVLLENAHTVFRKPTAIVLDGSVGDEICLNVPAMDTDGLARANREAEAAGNAATSSSPGAASTPPATDAAGGTSTAATPINGPAPLQIKQYS